MYSPILKILFFEKRHLDSLGKKKLFLVLRTDVTYTHLSVLNIIAK